MPTVTVNKFKNAIRLDGNLKSSDNKLQYVISQIDYCRSHGQISSDQSHVLYDWAYDKYEK